MFLLALPEFLDIQLQMYFILSYNPTIFIKILIFDKSGHLQCL